MRSCRGYFDEIAQPIVFKLTIKCTYMDTPIRMKVLKYSSALITMPFAFNLNIFSVAFKLPRTIDTNQVDETSANSSEFRKIHLNRFSKA